VFTSGRERGEEREEDREGLTVFVDIIDY